MTTSPCHSSFSNPRSIVVNHRHRRYCRPEVELVDLRIHSTSHLPVSSVGAARTRRGRLSARIREQELPARPWHSNGAGQAAAAGAPCSAMAFVAALMDKGRGRRWGRADGAGARPRHGRSCPRRGQAPPPTQPPPSRLLSWAGRHGQPPAKPSTASGARGPGLAPPPPLVAGPSPPTAESTQP